MTPRLFAIYIGGEHPGANIEVHDIRFVVAPALEATYPALRAQWWGRPGSLHIDGWAEIDRADGYRVSLRPEPAEGPLKLFYVNLGGYDATDFVERHRNVFVVAETVAQAKARAVKRARDWMEPHRDDLYEAEQAFGLEASAEAAKLHIHLIPDPSAGDPAFTTAYTPIRSAAKSDL